MSVAQRGEHLRKYLEQLLAVHVIVYAYLIYIVYLVPIDIFVVEKAVVLIDDMPQGLEVACGCIGAFFLLYAGSKCKYQEK
jgi:hypothetical protein